uniref:Uncharacterized protein n=1 Tax=Anguilla anguilla TaxID=7936 RepID=A0A0E9VBA5_ANGAN
MKERTASFINCYQALAQLSTASGAIKHQRSTGPQ